MTATSPEYRETGKMSKILITGITGLAGGHLAEFLIKLGHDVSGFDIHESSLSKLGMTREKIQFYECDIRDAINVRDLIQRIQPEMIFHLAAITFGPTSWQDAQETYKVNVLGTMNVLEAAMHTEVKPLIHIAGSSAEYGMVYERENPVSEHAPLRPLSPYGVSKIAQTMMGYQYYMNYGLHIVRTRAFNYTGPGENASFVCSTFAKQIAEIEQKSVPPIIHVGNLDTRRDFTDVRDVVRGYWLALERGKAGEVYNVCSGTSYAIRQALDLLLKMSSNKDIEIVADPDRLRPSDVPIQVGDFSKIKQQTGWEPTIPFEKTLGDLLEYWRTQVG
jgi:GDP-4-dehydro-6-deoxy-D-mannose reductase